MKMLEDSRETAQTLQERMKTAEETSIRINQARDMYRDVSCRGALLYFVLQSLTRIDYIYSQSLDCFIELFCNVIRLQPKTNSQKQQQEDEEQQQEEEKEEQEEQQQPTPHYAQVTYTVSYLSIELSKYLSVISLFLRYSSLFFF